MMVVTEALEGTSDVSSHVDNSLLKSGGDTKRMDRSEGNTYTDAKDRRTITCSFALVDICNSQSRIPGRTIQPTSVTMLVAVLV